MINLFSIHKFFADAFTFYGGPSGGGTSTSYTSNVPKGMEEEAKNLYNMMQQQLMNIDAEGNVTGFKSFVPYSANPADYVAGFSPMQEQSFKGAANLSVPGQFGQATDLAGAAGMGGINSAQQAYDYGAQGAKSGMMGQNVGLTGGQAYGNMGAQYGAQGAGYGDIAAQIGQMGLQAQQTGQGITQQSQDLAAQQAAAGDIYQQLATNPEAVQAYMSPYQQAVTQQAIDSAYRNAAIQKTGRQAAAAKAGAFGGSRQAIENAEAQRALNDQIQNIEAQGLQSAYDKAIQSMQYGTNLGVQGLGGAQSGLGTALQGGQLGLSGIGTALQGLQGGMQGSGLGIQGAQAGLQGVNAQLAGTAQGMQGAGVGLQGVSGAQAGYGLANQAGSNLANIGTQQNQAAQSILDQQNRFGAQQQQQQQNITNQAIQNYAMAQENPMMAMQQMSNMIRGTQGQGMSTANYQAGPSVLGTAASLGTAALGAKAAGVFAEGGIVKLAQGGAVKGYADGGVTGIDNLEKIAGKLSIPQLQQAMQNKTVPEYVGIPLLQMKTEEAQRAQAAQAAMQQGQQGGQAPTIKDQIMQQAQQADGMQGIEGLPSNLPTEEMADGGIVAFAGPEGSLVEDLFSYKTGANTLREASRITPFGPLMNLGRDVKETVGSPAAMDIAGIVRGTNESIEDYLRRASDATGIPLSILASTPAQALSQPKPQPKPQGASQAIPQNKLNGPYAPNMDPVALAEKQAEVLKDRFAPRGNEGLGGSPEVITSGARGAGGAGGGGGPKIAEYDTSAQKAILARQKNPDTGKFYTEDELIAKEEGKRNKAGIEDIYTPERNRLEREISGLEGKKKEALGLAMMQGAFDALAKGDPNAARSLGLIGSGTMKALTPALKEIRDSEKDMRKQQFNLKGLQQEYKQAVLSGNQAAIDKYQAKLDTVETNLEAARNKNVEAQNAVKLKVWEVNTEQAGLTQRAETMAGGQNKYYNALAKQLGFSNAVEDKRSEYVDKNLPTLYKTILNNAPDSSKLTGKNLANYNKALAAKKALEREADTKFRNLPGMDSAAVPADITNIMNKYQVR